MDHIILNHLPATPCAYAEQLVTRFGLDPSSAALSLLLGCSAAIGKCVYIESMGDQVHPNLFGMFCAPSGAGKKAFSRTIEQVASLLRAIERESYQAARKAKLRLAALDKMIEREMAKVSAQTPAPAPTGMQMNGPVPMQSAPDLTQMEQRRAELLTMVDPRQLVFGEDFTPQAVVRAITSPGQGGACVQNTTEGALFFSRIAPTRQSDPGYATLYTSSFNDSSGGMSRVDGGNRTHHSVDTPRIILSVAIQPAPLAVAVRTGNTPIGFFQRFLFDFSDGANSSIADTMFSTSEADKAPEQNFRAFCEMWVNQFWANPDVSHRLQLTPAAMGRIQSRVGEYEAEKAAVIETSPTRAEYLARQPELLLKIVQNLHAFQHPDMVEWIQAGDPRAAIQVETVDHAIALLDHLFEGTMRFFDTYIGEREENADASAGRATKKETPFEDRVWNKLVDLYARGGGEPVDMGLLQKSVGRCTAEQIREVIDANLDRFVVETITNPGYRSKVVYRPKVVGEDLYQPTDTANSEVDEVAKSKPRSKVVVDFGEIEISGSGTNTAHPPLQEAPGASGAQYEGEGESYDVDDLSAFWDEAACGGYPTPEPTLGHGVFATPAPTLSNQTEARKI
jgi:hypothetical protein